MNNYQNRVVAFEGLQFAGLFHWSFVPIEFEDLRFPVTKHIELLRSNFQ